MPIDGIVQPESIPVSPGLRLRRYEGRHTFALPWYQDAETLWLVDGCREPYDEARLAAMYTCLDSHGELYWIERLENGAWRPIGDVTFSQEDMPIVIGEAALRGRGIGLQVILALVQRGRELGLRELGVREIYEWNAASRRCFEKAGFHACGWTEKGVRMRRTL